VNGERFARTSAAALMLLVGAVAWWMQLRPDLRVDLTPLENLPKRIDRWEGRDVSLDQAVENMLEADFSLLRTFVAPDDGQVLWLYIGYYGTHRGGRPEHTPSQCYPSSGWSIDSERVAEIGGPRPFEANEWIVSRGGERRLVQHWYRSARRTGMLGNLSLGLDHLHGRLHGGRADGALVRISTPLEPSEEAARARLNEFAAALETQLARAWPTEEPAG